MLFSLIARFVAFFQTTPVPVGARVNEAPAGHVIRTDGVVLAHVAGGALVEWNDGGTSTVPQERLSLILT